jgi:hypothetical protein
VHEVDRRLESSNLQAGSPDRVSRTPVLSTKSEGYLLLGAQHVCTDCPLDVFTNWSGGIQISGSTSSREDPSRLLGRYFELLA